MTGLHAFHEAVTVCIHNLQSLGVETKEYAVAAHHALVCKIPVQLELEYYKRKDQEGANILHTLLSFTKSEVEC